MDYVKSVTFVTEDKKWIEKIGLGALWTLLSFVFVGIFALSGWAMEIFRRVVRGDEEPLAGWQDLGGYIGQGLRAFAIGLIWSIPVGIISIVSAGLGSILGIPLYFLSLGSFMILALTDDFKLALDPRNAWKLLNRNLNAYIVAALVAAAISALASAVGGIVCGVGLLITMPWAVAATAYLMGKVYVETGSDVYDLDAPSMVAAPPPPPPPAAPIAVEPVAPVLETAVLKDRPVVESSSEIIEPSMNATPRLAPVASSEGDLGETNVTRKLEQEASDALEAALDDDTDEA